MPGSDGAPTLEPLLAALVAADSSNPPGNEQRVAAVIEDAAAKLGLPPVHRHARAEHRPNLIYELGSGAPTLLVAAHMDTVPADDLPSWGDSPLRLRTAGDAFVGLGVADMKGAIAAMLIAAARLRSRLRRGRLLLAFTADEEEATGHGMQWLCDEGRVMADAAVLLEPASTSQASWDALYVAERGSCVVELTARGQAGHSGEPLPAATRAGTALIDALVALRDADLFAEHRHQVDGTGPIVSLPTMLSGGFTPWAHPERFRATLEIRTVPGMHADDVLAELNAVVEARGLSERVALELSSWGEPTVPVADPRLLAATRDAAGAVLGRVPPDAVFPASTDAGFLARIGIPALPALGPGTLTAVHRPNEWVLRNDLDRTVALIEELALSYLGHDG